MNTEPHVNTEQGDFAVSESTTEHDPVSNQGAARTPHADDDSTAATPPAAANTESNAERAITAAGGSDDRTGGGSDNRAGPGVEVEESPARSGAADAVAAGAAETGSEVEVEVVAEVEVDSEPEEPPMSGEALLVQEGEIAGDYLEQLLDILDYDGDIDLDVEGGRAIVAIVGADDLDPLVGARGVTLDALQELTRLTVAQQTGVRTRLMLDVGGYRAGRRSELSGLAATSVTRVIASGETLRMTPMNAFERKIVHDVVTATDGVRSESEGEDPDRRVVILPDR